MHANRHRQWPRRGVRKTACSSRTTLAAPWWPCTTHHDQFWAVHSVPKCHAVFPFIFVGLMCNFFWKPRGDQIASWEPFDEICDMQTAKCGLQSKREHGALRGAFCSSDGQKSRPSTFEASNFRFPTLKPKLAAGQRRKCRLVCEWVLMMYGYFSLSTNRKAHEMCQKE